MKPTYNNNEKSHIITIIITIITMGCKYNSNVCTYNNNNNKINNNEMHI